MTSTETTPSDSSRIIVKNIGKNTTESQLKEIFNRKGEVTDVRIQKTKSGKSREFAFIGYRTIQQAVDAQQYFNHTFIQTSKITVDIAKSIHDSTLLANSKSRHTKKKLEKQQNLLKKENEMKKKPEIKKNNKNSNGVANSIDRSKAEFFEVMKSRSTANIWGNDDDAQIRLAQEKIMSQQNRQTEEAVVEESGDDESDDSDYDNNIVLETQPKMKSKIKSQKYVNDDSDSNSDVESGSDDGIVKGKKSTTVRKSVVPAATPSGLSDLDFLRGKVKKDIKEDSDSDDSDSESDDDESEEEEEEEVETKPMKNKNDTTVHYLQDDDDEEEEDEDSEDNKDNNSKVKEHSKNQDDDNEEDKKDPEEAEEEEGRLFIRNLPYSVSEEELRELFSQYGPISQIHLPLNEDKRGKGYGFVQFMIPEHSKRVITALDGTSFQGRLLHIIPAKAQISHAEEISQKNSHLSSFQKKKEEERKKMANRREGWNASYVRSDTVVDSLSDKYGISRGDILDTDGVGGGELAVRLAIGETQIIQENKEYFLSHGVDIDSLESALSSAKSSSSSSSKSSGANSKLMERSTTTLLIKNLPHDCISDELEEMFSKFGSIASFLLPPSKTVALIDFTEPSDARRAFTNLAYRRYHHVPLYLEWAPLNTVTKLKQSTASTSQGSNKKTGKSSTNPSPPPPPSSSTSPQDLNSIESASNKRSRMVKESDDSADYSTLYLKNLNFQTTEKDLESHLIRKLGINGSEIRTISIPKKQSKSGQQLSMGYGFIEFKTIQGAVNMLNRINGSSLDEHVIEAKPSDKRLSIPQQSLIQNSNIQNSNLNSNSNETNKLIIRNVAFQATKEELKTLFSSFGTIKTIRIPRKIGGVHRGFAFVDFTTKQEATRAMNALSRTHMYGRHLVIEYAKNEEEMSEKEKMRELRERAENNLQMVMKTSQQKKRKVGEILDAQGEGVDLMLV